jgi:drug/metabolite transporter (DMT)-like permease
VSADAVPAPPGPARPRSVLSTSAGTHRGAFSALDWTLFASIGAIWGASFLLIDIGLNAFQPGLVTWLRILLGACVLWLFPGARRPLERADRPRLVALSLLWIAIPMTLFPFAEQHISSGLAGLVNGALPVFVAAVGAVMTRRPPRRRHAVGLVLGFAGVGAIAAPALGAGASEAAGLAIVLLAFLCYGFAVNIAAPINQRYGSLPVTARMLGLAALFTAPLGLWSIPRSHFAWGSLAAVAVLGMVGTGLAFVLMGRLVARVGSTRASFAIYLTPVVALILGAVFRDETVEALSVFGIALVIGGAILASGKDSAP